jgi:hypothetical protein
LTYETSADNIPRSDGDEIRIKNTFYENITEFVTKEIGNNVQTVSCFATDSMLHSRAHAKSFQVSHPHGLWTRLYNLTRDNILEWEGETPEWQYVPDDPYEWLDAAWPNGYK